MPHALSVDTLWSLDRLAAPALSPDGRRALCTLTRHDLAASRSDTSLWRFDTDGAPRPRRLTTAPGRLLQPAWSPRGDHIAFLGVRTQQGAKDERPQLYLIGADGGEARRATAFAPGFEAFRWLPDGRGVLASAWVWPGLRGTAAQARRHKAFSARKESGYATEQAQWRQWDHEHPMDRVLHLMHVDLASGRVTDLFEGTAWELPREDATPEPFDASPDGRHAAFAFDPAREKRNGNRLAVAAIDLATRRVRVHADDAAWSFEQPRWSPDGRRLAVLAAQIGVAHTMPLRPALIDRCGREPRWQPLGLRWDHEASSPPRWAPDGASLLLTAEHRGRGLLWRCTPDGGDGRFDVLTDRGWVQGFDVGGTPGDERVLTLRDAHDHPPQLFVQRASGSPRRLDRCNDRKLARVARGRCEEHTITGAQGEPVQMWLTYPPDFDAARRHPVMHVIHGGPYTAAGDTWSWRWNVHVLASRGHVVAQVNYHGSSGFGHAFKHSIIGRLAQLEAADVEAATDWLRRQRWVDRERVYATGGSYGGFLCAWLNAHAKPGRYRAQVCHAGVFDRVATFAADSWATRRLDLGDWYWDDLPRVLAQSPHAHAAGMNTPALVIHGARDYRVPDCNGLAYYNTLKARGVDARLLWFPDENHWVLKPANSRQWHAEFFAWLERHGLPR